VVISGLRVQDRIEAIPFAADCFHPLSVAAKLFAQTANMSVYRPSFHRILIAPNIIEQSLSRLSASAPLDQGSEQLELG